LATKEKRADPDVDCDSAPSPAGHSRLRIMWGFGETPCGTKRTEPLMLKRESRVEREEDCAALRVHDFLIKMEGFTVEPGKTNLIA